MSGEYVELLRRRSKVFLQEAENLVEKGEYDIALFFLEQAAQLAIKALIYQLFGEKPRLHSLRQLLGLLVRSLRDAGEEGLAGKIAVFVESNRDILLLLEDAYTGARYGYMVAGEDETRTALNTVRELLAKLEEIIEALER